jgi:hypothetical protein
MSLSEAINSIPEVPVDIADDASIGTKGTQITMGSTSTRRTVRSAANRRKKEAAERRVFIRDMFANLFDLVGDWAYFMWIFYKDFDGDGEADQFAPAETEHRLFIHAVFAFAVLSSVLVVWFAIALILRKNGKKSMCCNCTSDRIVAASIALEDVPQILFTLYMDYHVLGGISGVGALNICSSLNGMVNRLTSHYEEVKDDIFVVIENDAYASM